MTKIQVVSVVSPVRHVAVATGAVLFVVSVVGSVTTVEQFIPGITYQKIYLAYHPFMF